MNKIGINDFILECWGVDDAGWTFQLFSGEVWDITAVSESLGTFKVTTWDSTSVEETLARLLNAIKLIKEEREEANG